MSIRKTVVAVKLAAAALAVAGMVGTVWAALPTGPVVASDVMKVTLTSPPEGTIKCTSKNPKNAEVVGFDVREFKDLGAGNLGRIRVTASSSSWDISMKTQWGGKLATATEQKGAPKLQLNINTGKYDTLGYEPSTFSNETFLYYNGKIGTLLVSYTDSIGFRSGTGTNDTVQLAVSIGILDSAGGAVGFIPKGVRNAIRVSPTVIWPSLLQKSRVDGGTGVSFATALGDDPQYAGGVGKDITVGTEGGNGRLVGTAATKGFGVATTAEFFYINVGIPSALSGFINSGATTQKLEYSETFTFELVASF
jgi:hypothetical protein